MAVLSDAVLKRIGELLGNHKDEMSFRILHTSSSKSWNDAFCERLPTVLVGKA